MLSLAAFAFAKVAERGTDHTGVCYTASLFQRAFFTILADTESLRNVSCAMGQQDRFTADRQRRWLKPGPGIMISGSETIRFSTYTATLRYISPRN